MVQRLIDQRGYAGGERNRALDPGSVIWARAEYFAQRISARQLAREFGMSIDSVRRMLRGDTYTNVGEALPREREAVKAVMEVDDGGVLERLLAESRGEQSAPPPEFATPFFDSVPAPAKPGEPTTGDEAVEQFLRESKR